MARLARAEVFNPHEVAVLHVMARVVRRCLAPVLERLGIELEDWRTLTKDFGRMFSQVAGKAQSIAESRSLKTKRRFYAKRLVA